MSEQKITVGLVAKVVSTPKIDKDELHDLLHDNAMGLSYDGKFIYFNVFDDYCYNFSLMVGVPDSTEFVEKCWKFGIGIEEESIKPFFAYWYDGCDSPMSTMNDFEFMGN